VTLGQVDEDSADRIAGPGQGHAIDGIGAVFRAAMRPASSLLPLAESV
jgi:hypothetical protein